MKPHVFQFTRTKDTWVASAYMKATWWAQKEAANARNCFQCPGRAYDPYLAVSVHCDSLLNAVSLLESQDNPPLYVCVFLHRRSARSIIVKSWQDRMDSEFLLMIGQLANRNRFFQTSAFCWIRAHGIGGHLDWTQMHRWVHRWARLSILRVLISENYWIS
jgi:hypothetical protein